MTPKHGRERQTYGNPPDSKNVDVLRLSKEKLARQIVKRDTPTISDAKIASSSLRQRFPPRKSTGLEGDDCQGRTLYGR